MSNLLFLKIISNSESTRLLEIGILYYPQKNRILEMRFFLTRELFLRTHESHFLE
jgi:hypothetical protein